MLKGKRIIFLNILKTHTIQTYETIIPLSTENESVGNPKIFHALITTGSPRTRCNEKLRSQTILNDVTCLVQFAICSCLNCMVKGPRYAITPDAMRISPEINIILI